MYVRKIPTLHGFTALSAGSHRPGLFARTMGDDNSDFNQEAANAAGMDSSTDTSTSAVIQSQGGSPASFDMATVPGSGISSILASITPSVQKSAIQAVTSLITGKPAVVYAPGYVAPPSTLPSWLLPVAAGGLLLLLMTHKKG